jgi:CBS domain containing-hemolysin-like protein
VDLSKSEFAVTEAEIEDLVRIGSEEGSIEADRGEILQNVFDLWETSVRSIMTPRTQVSGLDQVNAEMVLLQGDLGLGATFCQELGF